MEQSTANAAVDEATQPAANCGRDRPINKPWIDAPHAPRARALARFSIGRSRREPRVVAARSLAVDERDTHALPPVGPARDDAAMALALDEASRTAASKGEVPVRACSRRHNRHRHRPRGRNAVEASHDATAHASTG